MKPNIRTTAPAANNKYYVSTSKGGYNPCLVINKQTGSVLPNCVGYSYGAFMEEVGITSCKLSRGNADTWYGYGDGYPRGYQPKVGGVMCWRGGQLGMGHVAIVTKVEANGKVTTANSNYSGNRFFLQDHYPPYNFNGLTYQGCIYNPYIEEEQMNQGKMKGCDVSQWNDLNTDISKFDFVIIRATWGTNLDEKANDWRLKCEKLGIPYGVYCYSYALDVTGGIEEAEFICDAIKGWDVRMGVWIDMEDADNYKKKHNALNSIVCSSVCQVFCQKVQERGYYTGIYASQSWLGTYIKGCDEFDKWVANWGNNDGAIHVDTESIGTMLQYTSNGGLDKDISYCEVEHYRSYPSSEEPVVTPEPEQPEAPSTSTDDDYKINWKQKLSSRKFWALIAGLIIATLKMFGIVPSEEAIEGELIALGSIVAYIIGESWIDVSRK